MAIDIFDRIAQSTGFEWDAGNALKLQARHQVSAGECEQVFFHEPLLIAADASHSKSEERWAAWGRTADRRALTIVFTPRGNRIRQISARDMNRKERQRYAEAETKAENQADS